MGDAEKVGKRCATREYLLLRTPGSDHRPSQSLRCDETLRWNCFGMASIGIKPYVGTRHVTNFKDSRNCPLSPVRNSNQTSKVRH